MSCIVKGVSGVRLPPGIQKHVDDEERRRLVTERRGVKQRTPRVSNLYWGVGPEVNRGDSRVPKPTVLDLVEEVQTNLV